MITKEKEDEFIEVAICIRSGQVEPRQIIEYMNINPEFKKWYEDRNKSRRKTTYGKLKR